MKKENKIDLPVNSLLGKLIKFCLENRLIIILFFSLLCLVGFYVSPFDWKVLGDDREDQISVDAIPDIGENQQIIFTEWKGRSPQDVEDQITYPLTSALLGLPGVKTVRSNSYFGFSTIYVIFKEEIEFYWSRSRILEKLSSLPQKSLPEGVQPKLGPDATGLGQVFSYTIEGRDPDGKPIGGWDLEELRSVQDWQVKFALSAVDGVSEVSSVGGFVKEYQIDLDPEKLQIHNISMADILASIKHSNLDIGAKTLEINKVEYFIRGLGFIQKLEDLENIVIKAHHDIPMYLKEVAFITEGPSIRRGALDKGGAEVVGGTVVARYGFNPMQAIKNVKKKILMIEDSLGTKVVFNYNLVKDKEITEYEKLNGLTKSISGQLNHKAWLKHLSSFEKNEWPKWVSTSQLKIIPFYDRTKLIDETLGTLKTALTEEILITIIVVLLMVFHVRSSLLISGMLPAAILITFLLMKIFGVEANVVALSGIAIAIGTMVDMGIVLCENILKHLEQNEDPNKNILQLVYDGTIEVGGAVLTAVATTIISFLPVFLMIGPEGKLFKPLAWTKTFALVGAIMTALLLIPPIASFLFSTWVINEKLKKTFGMILVFTSMIIGLNFSFPIGMGMICFIIYWFGLERLPQKGRDYMSKFSNILLAILISGGLSLHWSPLGLGKEFSNFFFVSFLIAGLISLIYLVVHYYEDLLKFCLYNKGLFCVTPILILLSGFTIWSQLGREFMPRLNEGSFLYMPSTNPHASFSESMDALRKQDMLISEIQEVESIVGKIGRVDSSLDPAPLSMVETIINYKDEYILDREGRVLLFEFVHGEFVRNKQGDLIPNKNGRAYRQWRDHIKTPDDIWQEIEKVARIPGSTSAPKLQPIETRIIMLQTGMRAPIGIKIFGHSLNEIEDFSFQLERLLKNPKLLSSVNKNTVNADKVIGKPYIEIKLNRIAIARYGLYVDMVQKIIQSAVGGMVLTSAIEGRERYDIRIRYKREKRDSIEEIKKILVSTPGGKQIPLGQLVSVDIVKGPQAIKSEDTFLVSYLTFDKNKGYSENEVVSEVDGLIKKYLSSGDLLLPKGIRYEFAGNFQNEQRATRNLMKILPIVMISIFIILYLQFHSIANSLIISSGVLVAWAGGFVMLWFYQQSWFMDISILGIDFRDLFQIRPYNLSVAIWVGFLALFGIATDDGVIMGTYIKQKLYDSKPTSVEGIRIAILEAGKRRIRPCMMTVATTILALIPVLCASGKGSDIMIPMAIPTFGGMILAIITVFIVPVLFCWKEEIKLKLNNNEG